MAIKKSKQGETRENVYVNEAPRIFFRSEGKGRVLRCSEKGCHQQCQRLTTGGAIEGNQGVLSINSGKNYPMEDLNM